MLLVVSCHQRMLESGMERLPFSCSQIIESLAADLFWDVDG